MAFFFERKRIFAANFDLLLSFHFFFLFFLLLKLISDRTSCVYLSEAIYRTSLVKLKLDETFK